MNAVEPEGPLSESVIFCGAGYDTVYVDRRDMRATRFRDCEMVALGPPPAPTDPHQGRQAIGGGAADALGGTDLNDTLLGGSGDDTFTGFAGDDVIWGDHVPARAARITCSRGRATTPSSATTGRTTPGRRGRRPHLGRPRRRRRRRRPRQRRAAPGHRPRPRVRRRRRRHRARLRRRQARPDRLRPGTDTAFVDHGDSTVNCELVRHQ